MLVIRLHYNSKSSINHAPMKKVLPCPCGSNTDFKLCCGPILSAEQWPTSAEQLMRSRYTAFCMLDENYLLASWHSTTRPASLGLDQQEPVKWVDLRVLNHTSDDDKASVEFVARYKINGKAHKLHEKSRFIKQQGRWFYVDGDNIA